MPGRANEAENRNHRTTYLGFVPPAAGLSRSVRCVLGECGLHVQRTCGCDWVALDIARFGFSVKGKLAGGLQLHVVSTPKTILEGLVLGIAWGFDAALQVADAQDVTHSRLSLLRAHRHCAGGSACGMGGPKKRRDSIPAQRSAQNCWLLHV